MNYSMNTAESFRKIRIAIFLIGIALICWGTVMVYSASGVFAYERMKDAGFYLKRHLLFLGIGILTSALIMGIDLNQLRRWAKPLMLSAILLLVLVLIPGIGQDIGGARRWFRIGPYHIQPVEVAKYAIILYLSDTLSRKQSQLGSFLYGFLPPVIVLGIVLFLILLQPDLGSVILISLVGVILFYIAGMNSKWLVATFLSGIPVLGFLIVMEPYRMKRILAFLNPWADPRGSGFQIIQSLLAFGAGGLWGMGLGRSTQKLYYLPEAHTDFIFSIIAEEMGFIGTLTVVLLFLGLAYYGAKIAFAAKGPFLQLLAMGILCTLVLQAIVNMGVSTASLPTKGLPLPFISYGGSALIFNCVALGLLLNIARDR